MATITDEQLKKLKADNPGESLHLLSNPDTDDHIVCKGPSEGEWKRFRATGPTALERIVAYRNLVTACLVYPSREEFSALLAERPALAETFAGELSEIAGVSRTATHRKL